MNKIKRNIPKHSDILKEDWDILIILDACRYDTFIKCIDPYFANVTRPVNSEASDTINWLYKHWSDKKRNDILYISGNTFIASKKSVYSSYHAYKFFGKVVDTWMHGWDKESDTVMPVSVYFDFLFNMNEYKRTIVHFLQPHAPYMFKVKKITPLGLVKRILPKEIQTFIFKNIKKIISYKTRQKLYREADYKHKYTDDEIKEAYEENLKYVLPYVYDIIRKSKNKKIIITSDHAEYLGENGRYGHGGEPTKLITTVPYLMIEV